MSNDLVTRVVLLVGAVIVSGTFHEFMHAWSALRMGDTTGRDAGRLTLNPFPHLDLWNSVLLPVFLAVSTQGRLVFGGMRPCPINPLNFRNPGLGFALSAAAGPLTNYALALLFFLITFLFHRFAKEWIIVGTDPTYNARFFIYMIVVNLVLGTFNLVPIPPLDGSRILRHYLPDGGKTLLDSLEPFGMILVIFFCLFIFGAMLTPLTDLFQIALNVVFQHDARTLVEVLR
jgi:Zn-dependent protease